MAWCLVNHRILLHVVLLSYAQGQLYLTWVIGLVKEANSIMNNCNLCYYNYSEVCGN
jgi:hypothetical protein